MGFRYTAVDLARRLEITGWIRNLQNGEVEIVAEAQEESLKQFLEKLSSGFSRYIRGSQADWKPATGEFSGFAIKF